MKNHLKMRAMREHRFQNIQCKTYIEAYFAFKFFWPLIKWFSEAESKSVSSVGWSLSVLMLFCRFVSIHMCKLSEEKKKFIWKRKRKERETTSSEERKKLATLNSCRWLLSSVHMFTLAYLKHMHSAHEKNDLISLLWTCSYTHFRFKIFFESIMVGAFCSKLAELNICFFLFLSNYYFRCNSCTLVVSSCATAADFFFVLFLVRVQNLNNL